MVVSNFIFHAQFLGRHTTTSFDDDAAGTESEINKPRRIGQIILKIRAMLQVCDGRTRAMVGKGEKETNSEAAMIN